MMNNLSNQTFLNSNLRSAALRSTDNRAAQGELPLYAVQRSTASQNLKQADDKQSARSNNATPAGNADSAKSQERSTKEQAPAQQAGLASPSSVNLQATMKEGIRRRAGELKIQADALLQRISMSTPEAAASLAKELKRLAFELKQLVAQYKALSNSQGSGSAAESVTKRVMQNARVSGSSDSSGVNGLASSGSAGSPTQSSVASDSGISRAVSSVESSLRAISAELGKISNSQQALETYESVQSLGSALAAEETPNSANADTLTEPQSEEQNDELAEAENAQSEDASMVKLFRDILEKLKLASELIKVLADRDDDAERANEAFSSLEDTNESFAEIEQLISSLSTS
jgi:hypothetical protein